jgi:hypothetical protein
MQGDYPVLAVGAEVGRVAAYERRILKETVCCPEITFNKKVPVRQTMAREQCMLRVYIQADCTKKCPEAKKILEEYMSSG